MTTCGDGTSSDDDGTNRDDAVATNDDACTTNDDACSLTTCGACTNNAYGDGSRHSGGGGSHS